MKIVIVIPARYASRRFPGKVLAKIDGEVIIERAWRRAVAWGEASRVVVVTDEKRVLDAARAFGAEVALIGEARTGSDRVARVAAELDADVVVNLQADEIDVDALALEGAVTALEGADMGTVACPLHPDELGSPDAVKVVCDRAGYALYFSRAPIGGSKHVGIYAFRSRFLQQFARLPSGTLECAESLEQLRALEHGHRIRVTQLDRRYRSINREEDVPHG